MGEPLLFDDFSITVTCPNCDRVEEFNGELNARASMFGHIRTEHSDKLPPFENNTA